MKHYETEARTRWGNTDAYREYEQKTKNHTKEKWIDANDGLIALFAEFAAVKASGARADSARAFLVAEPGVRGGDHAGGGARDTVEGRGRPRGGRPAERRLPDAS